MREDVEVVAEVSPSFQQGIGMFLILGSIIGVTVYGSVDSSVESENTKVL